MNIDARHVASSQRYSIADMHFRVCGPLLLQLAEAFAVAWEFATGEPLAVPGIVAAPAEASAACRVITDGPDEDLDKLLLVILGAIAVARREVLIMTPYFIPSPELIAALQSAALRGVDVSIVLPEHSNLRYVDWATRHWLPPLLERG